MEMSRCRTCVLVDMWRCGEVVVVHAEMCRCGDMVQFWSRCGGTPPDVEMCRCITMWRCVVVDNCRSGDLHIWRCVDLPHLELSHLYMCWTHVYTSPPCGLHYILEMWWISGGGLHIWWSCGGYVVHIWRTCGPVVVYRSSRHQIPNPQPTVDLNVYR